MKNDTVATIEDVAKAAGVSKSTVSRVINDHKHVRPQLRERVRSAMEELGYVPNRQARRLVGGRSNVIGLRVLAIGSDYIAEIIRGVDAILEEFDCDLMLYTTHRRKSKEAFYARSIAQGLADGLILVVPTLVELYLDALRNANFPHVLVDVDYTDGKSWSVGVTNWQGGYDATAYLLSLNHRRIAIVSDLFELSTSVNRFAGYQAALEEYEVPFDPALVKEDNYLEPNTRKLVEELLRLENPPTAIFTTSDTSAVRIMEVLRLHGRLVPQDISVIGFDDISQARFIYPSLTTIHAPLYEMGAKAVEVLLNLIEQPQLPPEHIQLPTRLVIRESCLALPTIE